MQMDWKRKLLRKTIALMDQIVDMVILCMILFLAFFGFYSIWDAEQLYSKAMANQYESYKPEQNTEGFEELKAINPEVIGWVQIYGTGIDYPLVQGEDNTKYVHTDPKGEYSMTGSLFLDYRSQPDFKDFNSIVYGHNMEKEAMFGGLHQFAETEYFEQHPDGSLYCDGKNYGLKIVAFFAADAYDRSVYTPALTKEEEQRAYLEKIKEKAIQYREEELTVENRLLLFSTCTSDMTNGRYLLAMKITEQSEEEGNASLFQRGGS